jgi:acyl phosphate:glycerol-3-phosphate acyltransferase
VQQPVREIAVFVVAFVLGSIPFGLWLGRIWKGIDVRSHGSGNLGATNVYRVLGPAPGIIVLLLDAGKGVAAVLLAHLIMSGGAAVSAPAAAGTAGAAAAIDWPGILALIGAVLGHSFTPFARFHGGKGVAAAAGAWGALAPAPLAVALGIWILLFAVRRIVSLASITAAVALPIATFALRPRPWADPVAWLAVVTCALIVLRHRSNLSRMMRGSEKPLDLHGPAGGAGPAH